MKILKLLFAFAFVATLSLSTTSCGGDDDSPKKEQGGGDQGGGDNNGGGSQGGDDNNGGGTGNMSESEKKNYVDATARELVDYIKADDFKAITDLGQYVSENLTRSTNRSSKTDVIEDFFEAAVKLSKLEETNTYIKRLFLLSNFSAEFSYESGVWTKARTTPENTLRFNFYDKNGQACVAEVVGSGKKVEVHASVFDEKHKYYDYSSYPYYTTYRTEENRFEVPEKVNVRLTQGNKSLIDIEVKISIAGGEFQYNSSAVNTTMNANIVGYKIELEKAYYNGGKDAGVSVKVSKNSTMLVSATASANVRFDSDGEFLSADHGNVKVDLLGKVQVKGTLDDFNKMRDLDKRINSESTEADVKDIANQMNKQFNIGIYFNNGSTRQAYLQAYPFLEKKSYYERWKIEPVIYFDDGTSYSTFEALGDDSRFNELVKKVKNLVTDFENLVK